MTHLVAVETKVRKLLDELNIVSAPIPVERIADSLGILVRYSPLDEELSGMIYLRRGAPIIGVNSHHHSNRQRFTIAHEIGHFIFHSTKISDQVHVDKKFPILMRDAVSAAGKVRMEIEANQFAAELLMPSVLLFEMLNRRKFDIDDDEPFDRLARKFQVSRQALEYRIRNTIYDRQSGFQ